MTRTELVAYHLHHYTEGRREVARYREVLKAFDRDTVDDTIETLTFPGGQSCPRVQNGKISDPTPKIAAVYRRTHRAETIEARKEIEVLANELAFALDSIQTCVEALEPEKRRIIEKLYFEGMSWDVVAQEEYIARGTLQYRRAKALEDISTMPLYLAMCFAANDGR